MAEELAAILSTYFGAPLEYFQLEVSTGVAGVNLEWEVDEDEAA